jgi:hypothetical protein
VFTFALICPILFEDGNFSFHMFTFALICLVLFEDGFPSSFIHIYTYFSLFNLHTPKKKKKQRQF